MTVEPSEDRPIVLRISRYFLCFIPIWFGSLVAWWEGYIVFENPIKGWIVAGLLVVTIIGTFFVLPSRYEISRTSLRHFKWQKLVAEYDLRDLDDVQIGQVTTIVFSRCHTIQINKLWTQYSDAVGFLKLVLDGKRAADQRSPLQSILASAADEIANPFTAGTLSVPDSSRVELSSRYLSFPDFCVRCQGIRQWQLPLKAEGGTMFNPLYAWVKIPLCEGCFRRRKRLGRLIFAF